MTIEDRTTPDGALQPALTRLADAISALCDPKPHHVEGRIVMVDPLYTQLRDALPGNRGAGSLTTGFTGCWISALDALAEIDSTVEAWVWTRGVVFNGEPATICRLHHLERHKFRPQDVHAMDQVSAVLEQWVSTIKELLGIDTVVCLNLYRQGATPASCPACGERWAWNDKAGERVRTPALQVRADGCRCAHCRTTWGVSQYQWLARVIGCET